MVRVREAVLSGERPHDLLLSDCYLDTSGHTSVSLYFAVCTYTQDDLVALKTVF